ncbi:MAG: acetyl-CoA acetyltransferase [Proteobacteria bacterium]|nr:acetyl-CoA acetyltransferase [Pseudomonadota bacterium]
MRLSPSLTPVLVGIGVTSRREDDWTAALEPMDLMLEAVQAAGIDAGSAELVAGTQYIGVPRGRWSYRNPAGELARAIGARHATTVLASVGVLQQSLIGEACARIARGEAHTTLLAGADAGYRLLRAQLAGARATERSQDDAPDVYLAPKEELFHAVESRAGFEMPVGLYAILESAYRARHGWSVAAHRERVARMLAEFSAIAAANPHAWTRTVQSVEAIRDAGPRNPMQAFPYTRAHCSTWNVDQAAALLFCSEARALELGIPRARWIYPLASVESNHMMTVSARADLTRCIGARVAGAAALAAADLAIDDVPLLELYSCFPIAVETYAEALGIADSRPLTLTGGMPFAGGPFNNYVFQASCRAAELLRARGNGSALVSSVSGMLTKQGFGLWATAPGPRGFVHADVSAAVAAEARTVEVLDTFHGAVKVAGYTVLRGRDQGARGVALVDTANGARVLTRSDDAALIARLECDEYVGRVMQVEGTLLKEQSA